MTPKASPPPKSSKKPPDEQSHEDSDLESSSESELESLSNVVNSIPDQNPLIRFNVSENGRLSLEKGLHDEDDIAILEALRSALLSDSGPLKTLKKRYETNPNTPQAGKFSPLVSNYYDELSKDFRDISFATLYVRGAAFYSACRLADIQVKSGEWPEPEFDEAQAIKAIHDTHGPLIMASAIGRRLVSDAHQYQATPETYESEQQLITEFCETVANEPELAEEDTAKAIPELVRPIENDPQLARSRHLRLIVTGSILTVIGGSIAWLATTPIFGPVGSIGAAGAGMLLWEILKKTEDFKSLTNNMAKDYDSTVKGLSASAIEAQTSLLERLAEFAKTYKLLIEKVAALRPEFGWVKKYIRSEIKPNEDPETPLNPHTEETTLAEETTLDDLPALLEASLKGDIQLVERLIAAGADVNQGATDDGTTALMLASESGHVKCVECLIAAGADVNQGTTDYYGTTALMIASRWGNAECVEPLIAAGADVNQRSTRDGTTALMLASKYGHVQIMELLIAAGADVNQGTTHDGTTALMLASEDDHVRCVERLIAAGADINHGTTDDGTTALMLASKRGHFLCVKHLVAVGANVNHRTTDNGATALMLASESGHVKCVECLIAAGADVNQETTDYYGTTALMLASRWGNAECVEPLIAAGADVNQGTTDDGTTALMFASENDHVECVKRLIAAGADVNQKTTDDGTTALMLARQKGHSDCVRHLIAAGAS